MADVEETTTPETIESTMEDVATLLRENPTFKVMLQNVSLRRQLKEKTAETPADSEDDHGS